ncbi:hypothetical protein ACFL20_12690 [Spirochaetota bacterium]
MAIHDRLILLITGLIAIYMIYILIKKQKDSATSHQSNIFYLISFAVLLVAGLLLIFLGWGILANNLIAIVSALIPFGLAIGLISKYVPKYEKSYLALMIIGLILISVSRLGELKTAAKLIYPIFHSIAGLTIFFVPIYVVKKGIEKTAFICVTIGGTIIGLGGIALAFLSAGKQLLFLSQDVVLIILAPILLLTGLFFALGLTKGVK